jgi:quercetin dioxygenase-like cupin family protein
MLRRPLVALVAALAAACAARAPRVPYGSLAGGLDAFLAAHPLASEQGLRVDPIGRTATASYHLVQVRDRETPHRHLAHDLTVLVLRGGGTLTLGPSRLALAAGDAAVVPRGEAHWFANGGRGDAVAFVVFSPPLDAPDSVPADVR